MYKTEKNQHLRASALLYSNTFQPDRLLRSTAVSINTGTRHFDINIVFHRSIPTIPQNRVTKF